MIAWIKRLLFRPTPIPNAGFPAEMHILYHQRTSLRKQNGTEWGTLEVTLRRWREHTENGNGARLLVLHEWVGGYYPNRPEHEEVTILEDTEGWAAIRKAIERYDDLEIIWQNMI